MSARARGGNARSMARYLLHHRHQPGECGVVFASFKGNQSCFATAPRCLLPSGGHETWCTVDASEADAARPLPFFYVAQRTTVPCVSEVQIP